MGLNSDDSGICTVEATVPTGMEDVCAEEAQQKLGVTDVVVAMGRAFFDISIQDVPKVLELRSVEHAHVVILMESKFPLTNDREECFSAMYHLAERPLWRKGVGAWQQVFGDLKEPPFAVDQPLTKSCEVPNPLLDLRLLKKESPVALNLPEDIKKMREEYRIQQGLTEAPVKNNPKQKRQKADEDQNSKDALTGAVVKREGHDTNGLHHNLPVDDTRLSEQEIQSLNQTNDPAKECLEKIMNSNTSSTDSEKENKSKAADLPSAMEESCSQLDGVDLTTRPPNCGVTQDLELHPTSESSEDNSPSKITSNSSAQIKDTATLTNCDSASANSTAPNDSNPKGEDRLCASGPGFRVTCNRAGTHHVFGSQEAARQLGAAVNDRFGWPVRLNKPQIEIILNVTETTVYVSLSLTREPLFRRNIVSFGPTNLRATICYALLHLGRPKEGDVVIDHMCGGASIPLEGALSFPNCFHLGGDIHEKAVARARENLDHTAVTLGRSVAADAALWDSTRLPLRTSTVDVVVSDLPFGKRSGSKLDNRVLYLRALQETARVTRPGTGRAVLLTHDKNSLHKNLSLVRQYWRCPSVRTINIGGLYAGVFLLVRTAALYTGLTKTSTETP